MYFNRLLVTWIEGRPFNPLCHSVRSQLVLDQKGKLTVKPQANSIAATDLLAIEGIWSRGCLSAHTSLATLSFHPHLTVRKVPEPENVDNTIQFIYLTSRLKNSFFPTTEGGTVGQR